MISKAFGADEDGADTTTINDIKQAILNGNGSTTFGGVGFIGTQFNDLFEIIGVDDVVSGKDGYIALNGGAGADAFNILRSDSFIWLELRSDEAAKAPSQSDDVDNFNDGFGNGTARARPLRRQLYLSATRNVFCR